VSTSIVQAMTAFCHPQLIKGRIYAWNPNPIRSST
jgi:hypothetical protein